MTAHDTLRVAFISQWYPPEPVGQPQWIVEGLQRAGAEVSVVTGIPNYPTGQVLAGYRAWRPRTEVVEGVPVRRTPLYPDHGRRSVKRIANYLSWAVTSTMLGLRVITRSDVALVYSSPATAATAALFARWLRGTPYVLLVQDLWPDSIFASGYLGSSGKVARRILDRLVNVYYRHASKILVISPGMIDVLARRGVPKHKLDLVYNWVPDEPQTAAPLSTPGVSMRARLGIADDDFVVMYAGNLGSAQALDGAVRGMGLLHDGSNAHLVLVGDGVQRDSLTTLAAQVAPSRVHVLPPISREEVVAMMEEADAQLVSLAPEPLFKTTMPSKVQSILASGHPVLCCVDGDVADIVTSTGSGVAARPGDAQAFAAAVQHMSNLAPEALAAMGESGRQYYRDHMAEPVGRQQLFGHLAEASKVG